jgi:hypothetical protein
MSKLKSEDLVRCVLIVVALLLLGYLVYNYLNEQQTPKAPVVVANNSNNNVVVESFDAHGDDDLDEAFGAHEPEVHEGNHEGFSNCGGDHEVKEGFSNCGGDHEVKEGFQNVQPSEQLGTNEQPRTLGAQEGTQLNQLPAECYPKDVLTSADLLPRDANSKFAQVAPSGQGSLADKNFLTAGFHIGINTVGQSLRNANQQLRSDPPNPQVKVSPWNQTTIESDTNRRPLEIGGN